MVLKGNLNGLALDLHSLSQLKMTAGQAPDQAAAGAARQFEALLLESMIKSMRQAVPNEDSLSSEASQMYTSMLDQQWAQRLSGKGIGLADAMLMQLNRGAGDAKALTTLGAVSAPKLKPTAEIAPRGHSGAGEGLGAGTPQAFANRMWNDAVQASKTTGIPAKFLIGQAALESGWGKREVKQPDGSPTFNIFGIKAGKNWQGATADVVTTEYVNGVPHKVVAKFRAYGSYAEAFADYGRLITENPRYAKTLEHQNDSTRFAQSLQKAGYATDPLYAKKLASVINHSALRELVA